MVKKIIISLLLICFTGCVTTEKVQVSEILNDELNGIIGLITNGKDTLMNKNGTFVLTDSSIVHYNHATRTVVIPLNAIDSVYVKKIDYVKTLLLLSGVALLIWSIIGFIELDKDGLVNMNLNFN